MSNLLNGGLSIYECFALFQKQEHHPFFQVEAFAFTDQLSSGMRLDHIVSAKSHYEKTWLMLLCMASRTVSFLKSCMITVYL